MERQSSKKNMGEKRGRDNNHFNISENEHEALSTCDCIFYTMTISPNKSR